MSDKLLPCPFCGGPAQLFEPGLGQFQVLHTCMTVKTVMQSGPREAAILAWNRRDGRPLPYL